MNRMVLFRRILPNKFPEVEIVHAEDAKEAKKLIFKNDYWDIVLLDHDLGGRVYVNSKDENTGYQFLKFFKEKEIKFGQLIYHTLNPVGGKNMTSLMPEGKHIPFPQLINLLKF